MKLMSSVFFEYLEYSVLDIDSRREVMDDFTVFGYRPMDIISDKRKI
jgi:hypothetical protein